MTVVQKEIKTIYHIHLTVEDMKEALYKSLIIKQDQQEEFIKRFKNILWNGEDNLKTRALQEIVRILGFDGIVNYGFWNNNKSDYRMSVYNWGAME